MKCLELTSKQRAMQMCHPKVWRTHGSPKHWIVLPPSCHLGPQPGGCHPVALIQNIVWRYEWLWWKNWGQYPYPLTLWCPPLWKICCMMLGLDSSKQLWQAQVGQFFAMGDIRWGRAWLQMRLEMLHSFSQELVCGLENQPTLPQIQWQFKRVKGPWLKPYQIIELRQGHQDVPMWICQPNNPSSLIPLEVSLQKMHLEIDVLTTHHHPVGPPEAKNIIGIRETRGINHFSSLHLPQTVGLRATGVHYQQLPQCHPSLTGQMDQDVLDKIDDIEMKGPTWR